MKDIYKKIERLKTKCDKLSAEIEERTQQMIMFAENFSKSANELVFRYKSALELAEKYLRANREQFNNFEKIKTEIMNYKLPVIETLSENFFCIKEQQSSHILVPYIALISVSSKFQKILIFFPNDTYHEYFNLSKESYRLSSKATLCTDDKFFFIHSGDIFKMSFFHKVEKATMKLIATLKCLEPSDAKIFIYNSILILVELFKNSSTIIEFYDIEEFSIIESYNLSLASLKGAILNEGSLFLATDHEVYEFDIRHKQILAEFECPSKIYMIYFHELLHIVCQYESETRSKEYIMMYCEDLHLDSPFPEYTIFNNYLCWGANKTYYMYKLTGGELLEIEL